MRYSTITLGALIAVVSACGGAPTIRDCALDEVISDNGHNLSYSAVMPSDCPVPLGAIGEQKFIGANIIDSGDDDYSLATTIVRNSAGVEKGSDLVAFILTPSGSKRAQPRADYPAATGYSGSIENGVNLPDAARDRGTFTAILNNLQTGAAGRVTVNYVGTNVMATISGPDVPLSGASATWTGSGSGGSGPYSYAWYRNGSLVSTASSYGVSNVGSSEFGLRLQVTDQTASTRWTDYWVDVDGVRATVGGPTLVYYSEGNATWTATIRGGYSSYAVNWYWDNGSGPSYAGSGTSLTSYPPSAGSWSLYATVTDSQGTATTSTSLYFMAIGDGNGGCTPIPPQITCDP